MNLYDELKNLKTQLQEANYNNESGRVPNICTEEALLLLNRYMPTTIEELKMIGGIGDNFTKNYGEQFIEVIKKYKYKIGDKMSNEELEIIEKLKNRLVQINARNRLLYTGKLNKKNSLDLNIFNNEIINQIKNNLLNQKTKSIPIFEIRINDQGDIIDESLYKNIISLYKEDQRSQKERGACETYIAYPYLQGKLENDDFFIKAPLILFPCVLEKSGNWFYISFDDSRDIVYNNNLLLANNKSIGKNIVLPANRVELKDDETYSDIFYINALKFYEENGLKIESNIFNDCKFFDNTKNEFPKYRNGEFEVKGYFILGLFPNYMTSMYKDFQTMIETKESNDLIQGLLRPFSDAENINCPALYNTEQESIIIEKEILYINELNYSQEKVLELINTKKSLVVQGPPGTGKSQTITSLIAQEVLKGKKVLMVSEKKAALDVIYSRLGKISDYSLFIDDAENKLQFYSQINRILNASAEVTLSLDYSKQINEIEKELLKLETLGDKVYEPTEFGISMQKVYRLNKKVDFNNELMYKLYGYFNNPTDVANSIKAYNYETIEDLKNKFNDIKICEDLKTYYDLSIKYPWLKFIKMNLTDFEYKNVTDRLINLIDEINNYNSYNIFKKVIEKRKLYKKYKEILNIVFIDINQIKYLKKDFILNINNFIASINFYYTFINVKTQYDLLNGLENSWFNILYYASSQNNIDILYCNDFLYNYLLYIRIEKFESENKDLLIYINKFSDIIKNLETNIKQKKELVKDMSLGILNEHLGKLHWNKNFNEMKRQCNLKRTKNVNSFISKFKFEILDATRIWLMTPEAVSDLLPFEKNVFDLVIFDEASQMYIEKGLPAIYRSQKVVIVGDTEQLKPSSLGYGRIVEEEVEETEHSGALEEESLLDLAQYRYSETMLNYHYRSIYEELIAFSNYGFYNGKLYVSPNTKKNDIKPIERIFVENGIWLDKQNIEEAKEIVSLVKKILLTRTNKETIGIITFNSSQRDLIEDLLEKEKMIDEQFANLINVELNRNNNGEDESIFVKNIENVQGDERDIIIFSIGYAKNTSNQVSINFGWLNQQGGENRLNVAISRAKRKIYIVTSIEPEELLVEESKNRGPKLFKKYLEYIRAIDNGNKELAQSILLSLSDNIKLDTFSSFDSKFEEEVHSLLVEKGYIVETKVGVGGYRVDLAIKDPNTNDYLLGIEFDERLYHNSKNARERDYHRQKYLESRGWKIYRIWSNNWWKNPNQEIEKIIQVLKGLN